MPSLSLLGLGLRRSRSRDAEDVLNLIIERAKRARVETEYHAARLLLLKRWLELSSHCAN